MSGISKIKVIGVAAVVRFVIVVGSRLMGFRRLQFGKCCFIGPKPFLEQIKAAVHRLADEDQIIWDSIRSQPFLFWYHRSGLTDNRIANAFTIPEGFLAWGAEGLISRIIYCYFLTSRLGRDELPGSELHLQHNQVMTRTREWLIQHEYPQDLQKPFERIALIG